MLIEKNVLARYFIFSDLPIIISGERLACFEPQEKIWRGEAGQAFSLSDLINQSSDFVTPLNGLAGFDSNSARINGYPHTIFRLPLRTQSSGLSDNIYNTQKLQELLNALRAEAKYLLLFLKSVCKIEVVNISGYGKHSSSFCVELDSSSKALLTSKRDTFMHQLKVAHTHQAYSISRVISFTALFSVVVTDANSMNNQAGTSRWLIANCVGSTDSTVQATAKKQRTFPWVGTVMEIGGRPVGGRIFCFLPMPVEAASGLPIHVNGTFGLNDERRTLKWPGIERRNDPTANWNKLLVSQLLPPCYAMLLIEAKTHITHEQFYDVWPDVNTVKSTQFSEILSLLFKSLFQQAVVWSEKVQALQLVGDWIFVSEATFVSESSSLPSIVKKVLTNCDVQLVTVPPNVWSAMRYARVGVTEVSPMLARSKLRSYPASYSGIDLIGKKIILKYCLSDNNYSDLNGLNLLPLANSGFASFDPVGIYGQPVYLCSSDCPRYLLPNLDHLLVDVSDDMTLQQSFWRVASSQSTKLRVLTENEVAHLLSQSLPSSNNLVQMPHPQIPSTWLSNFWTWLKQKNLQKFSGQLLVPCYHSTSSSTANYYLAPLSNSQAVVYVNMFSSCSKIFQSALYKMNVKVCLQSDFNFVHHRNLSSHVKQLNTNDVLDAISLQSHYTSVTFSVNEAESLKAFLISNSYTPSSMRKYVLQNISIFSSASNSPQKLHSVNTAQSMSVINQVIGEPEKSAFDIANLPSELILLSSAEYNQVQLLKSLNVSFVTDADLLVNYVFPLINRGIISDHVIDKFMPQVLDSFGALTLRNNKIASQLQNLKFVKTIRGRKSPCDLFTPLDEDIQALYAGENVFPISPYDTSERVYILQQCGLHWKVTPQEILDIIYSISTRSSQPQRIHPTKFNRAKAVLKYISTPSFFQQTGGKFVVANDRCTEVIRFQML